MSTHRTFSHRRKPIAAGATGAVLIWLVGCATVPPNADSAASTFGEMEGTRESFDQALTRLRTEPCDGLFWQSGTCDDRLFLTESTGRSALTVFFNRDSLLWIGETHVSDSLPTESIGQIVDCTLATITETVLCTN